MMREPRLEPMAAATDEWAYSDGEVGAVLNSYGSSFCEILELNSVNAGRGHAKAAILWLRERFGRVSVNDPGNELDSPKAFWFWVRMADDGLVDTIVDGYGSVFRRNRRRAFQRSINTILRIGREIGPTPCRGIVGDTWRWKKQHQRMILKTVAADVYVAAQDLARKTGCDIFDAIDEVRKAKPRHHYERRPSSRPILPPRRSGEERNTRSYTHPPELMPEIDGNPPLKHVPIGSKITGSRRRSLEVEVLENTLSA